LQFIAERACKPSADQEIELLILKKFAEPLPANPFSDSGMKDFNFAVTDFAANCRDAISIGVRFVAEPAQEFRAFLRQSKSDRNHLPREITPQTILDVTFSPCGFEVLLSLCGVALVSTAFPIYKLKRSPLLRRVHPSIVMCLKPCR
jgi:hypothetical protein